MDEHLTDEEREEYYTLSRAYRCKSMQASEVKYEIRMLHQRIDRSFERVYRCVDEARKKYDASMVLRGRDKTRDILRTTPQEFGQLRGTEFMFLKSPERGKALQSVIEYMQDNASLDKYVSRYEALAKESNALEKEFNNMRESLEQKYASEIQRARVRHLQQENDCGYEM